MPVLVNLYSAVIFSQFNLAKKNGCCCCYCFTELSVPFDWHWFLVKLGQNCNHSTACKKVVSDNLGQMVFAVRQVDSVYESLA